MEELLLKFQQLNPKAKAMLLAFLDFLFSDKKNRKEEPSSKPTQHDKLKSILLSMESWDEDSIQIVEEAHESFNQMELRKW